ncbi:MAG: IS4 family transposase [Clostridium celatum]|uniref:Transposase DDE domain protein n=1 Tax=Clostridium paraputrificum TaxID=29363 RepID=A0A6N3A1X7_9CLOT|nr:MULTISPECIES: IS4 family transposase [Clostridia]EQI75709.1 transposase DDE domain protein [Clostridioides difficile Y381]MDU1248459.1 IS4 family transposase [Veillonella sp.]MDU3678350.1 IS4 family transposase [Clostridium sp.]MDU5261936.1 IS4 family transposase [Clostridium celatum]
MKNTKLLSLILKETNNLITSDEYKEAYSLGNSFSRKRKLSFSNTVHFICSALRKSISSEIDNFIEEHTYLNFPNITKQAFSKARQNISPEAFNELCRLFVEKFYSLKKNLNTWNGFNILAIDGTSLQVPDTEECGKYFGLSSNQNKTRTAVATASALYDVLNDIIVDARITKYKTSERYIAKQHIEVLVNRIPSKNSIVIFDRGYPSYDMFDHLNDKGLLFLMRVSTSFKLVQSIDSDDSILEYKLKGEIKKVRVLRIKLSEDVTEVLVTNIYDEKITTIEFKELYFLRWGVESKYKELKSSIKIEEFSGTKPIAIEQDFYTSIYLSMISGLIKKDADASIANANKDKSLNSTYQSNRNFILGQVFKRIIKLLVKSRLRNKILKSILEKSIKIRSQVRCNRSCERKKKHPRKKHHHNIKSCI